MFERLFFSRVKSVRRWIAIFLFTALIGAGILGGCDEVVAGGTFDVPEVNEEFNEFEQAPSPQQEQTANTPSVKEEKGFWDSVTKPFTEAWDWTKDKLTDVKEWTTEKASSFWEWLTGVLSKITEVFVETLAATWDWIIKFKEYIAFAGVLILGIALCFFAPPLGIAVLTGMALSLLIGAGFNGWKFDKTVFLEAAIGGLLGLIGGGIASGASRAVASGFGKKMISSAANSKVLGSLARGGSKLIGKLPKPMQQIFTKTGFVGSVEGAGTSIADDLLHGKKFDWKKAIISALTGAFLVGTFHAAPSAVKLGEKIGLVGKACTTGIFTCTVLTNGNRQTISKQQLDNYLSDIEQQTGVKIGERQKQLIMEHMNNNTYTKLSKREATRKRARFDNMRDELIEEWERETGQRWPRHTEPYYTRTGKLYKRVGQKYDAHHIIENIYNGPDEWWNIHPARYPDQHQGGIHRSGAPGKEIFPRR
ncbi:MAG: hypothetical protein WB502_05290 [Thermoactinomyces sp.]